MSTSSRFTRVALLALLTALGALPTYASKDPLLTSDQSKLMEQRKKYLKRYAPAIRESLGTAESSILVLLHTSAGTPPTILPGDDPVELAVQRADAVKSADGCELVYRADLALAPVALNCALLERQAQERESQRAREEQTNSSLAALGKGIEDLKNDTIALAQATRKAEDVLQQDEALIKADEQSLDQHQQALNKHEELLGKNADSLKRTKAEIANSENVIGKTMKVVTIQQAELEGVGDSLKTLEEAYKNTTDVVGKNNQQIDSMISDLNTEFVQLQKQLDDMKQRLESIK
jgi:hypothetical protein